MIGSILIVDDSLTVRMDLAEAFEAAGLRVIPCADLASARRALTSEDIRLVVLDVLLPDGDGVDLLRELRATGGLSLPVLMLSTEAEVKDRIRGLTTGANEYVGKPYDTMYVVAKARDLLGAAGEGPDAQATILVIDDSDTYRNRLCDVLNDAGYRTIAAENGKAGLALLADRRPNAVIVDGIMPDMDGATLIRRVRLDAATRGLPCVLLTASEDRGAQVRALDAGADAFVRKDDDMDLILARIAAVMRRYADRPPEQVVSLSGPRKILAVDDSVTYLNELAEALRAEGYEVSLARSGEEALDLLAVQPVDCILMDLVMPGMGGKEACVRIKAATGVRDIPLILLTAHDDRTAMLEGLSAGADDYISKSSEFEVLCARVLAQIRRKQFEDENRRYREELLGRELAASEERSARVLAEARAAMVDELERTIEERTKQLEATIVERRHAERMASVGMLSASIAHEINNPLAIVIGNLELVRLSLNDLMEKGASGRPPENLGGGLAAQMLERLGTTEDPLRDALEAAERVREIVRDLRIFARSDGDSAVAPVDAHKVIESAIRMATNEVRHRARLVRDFGAIPLVRGNESRLGQVFLNLIVNAAQAMPIGQGTDNEIRISTRLEAGDVVVIDVADTGLGIPEDKIDRVFDPFFTTKPAGVGTGLGLAICHRIIGELGGTITVKSTVGKGTTFTVTLKRADATADAPAADTPALAAPPKRASRGRILVVDDEVSLCKTIERIISIDHDVVGVTSAKMALGVIGKGERFDVILSDVMMPEMTGMELFETLDREVPDQARRMIFMTGGAFAPEAAKFIAGRPYPAIEKPFRPSALREAVQTALSELGSAASGEAPARRQAAEGL